MPVDYEQEYKQLARVIYVPAHFSLEQTREAICSAVKQHIPEGGLIEPNSPIVIASGKILSVLPLLTHYPDHKAMKEFETGEGNTQLTGGGKFAVHAVLPAEMSPGTGGKVSIFYIKNSSQC